MGFLGLLSFRCSTTAVASFDHTQDDELHVLHTLQAHVANRLTAALFPFKDWWVVPAKVVFDQTAWSAIWNSIYFVVLGFLRLESPATISSELKSTFWPMLTAGWKLWPFAHLVTYGLVPVEQRLLWVDCVELIWVKYCQRKPKHVNFTLLLRQPD
ncbi:hypothetical protein OsJ_11563 [Oryza sativa Japonica Group]|uniref:Uncharacterized protein n=1 Tax=Oryza sativa subsp. japonica TaxID=39947 RepID=B9F9G5_ORYSJ|nr:hypothetical protein OsJ_11563 [Oryza sativa Japonica Group]